MGMEEARGGTDWGVKIYSQNGKLDKTETTVLQEVCY